jgi:hypothetical protein
MDILPQKLHLKMTKKTITIRYHFTTIGISIIRKITSIGENMKKLEPYTLLAKTCIGVAAVENSVGSSRS